jgi:hypothetical protein
MLLTFVIVKALFYIFSIMCIPSSKKWADLQETSINTRTDIHMEFSLIIDYKMGPKTNIMCHIGFMKNINGIILHVYKY